MRLPVRSFKNLALQENLWVENSILVTEMRKKAG